jgi:putative transposase
MEKCTYPSDLSDKEWQALRPLFRELPRRGRKRKWSIRTVLNAIFYVLKTGCQWRYLPANFPPWETVFYHFRQWQRRGKWFKVHETLRKATRKKAGRHPHASAAVLDSQSVKTTAEGAHFRGFDGNKKVKGRKRHVLVDTLGLLLSVYTTPANTGDRWGAKACLGGKKYFLPRLKKIWADANYTGDDLAETCARDGWELEIVKRPKGKFEIQSKRWIVERTLAWFLKYRRLSVDYERMPQTGESFTHIAMIRLMVRRLAVKKKVAG